MKIWTIQIAQWREAKRLEIPFLDTTFKSGDPVFAPPKNLVMGYKAGLISQEQYTETYLALMRESWMANRERWLEVLSMPEVAVACYCGADRFCHRHLLVGVFQKVCQHQGIEQQLMGEIRKGHVRTLG